jgi:ComF family protein
MESPLARLAGSQAAVLIPVPLDPLHGRRRGFNQATLLAIELSRVSGHPMVEALKRRTASRRQAESGRAERFENVCGAFYWNHAARLPAGRIILVDDVLTTGATAAACATVIGEAGRDCIGVVTFARALQRPDEG